ncbi:hypothetical protein [Tropicimonas sp.]|uniref:hypothetical protein n=1 Tax=Tropicimonas sp. TaxID=2067044 RepID=UPI003A8371C2
MTRVFLSTAALAALLALPATAQQQPQPFVPGTNFLATWDQDGNGAVTLDEMRQQRANAFASFDADNNGALSPGEFSALAQARAAAILQAGGRGMGRGGPAMSPAMLDINSDGAVSQQEYVAGADRQMQMLDRDGSGTLTTADFGAGPRGQGAGPQQGPGPEGMMPGMQGQRHGRDMGRDKGPDMRGPGGGRNSGCGMQHPGGRMPGMADGKRGPGHGPGQGRMHMMPRGKAAMGGGAAGPAPFQAFTTDQGALWIVDSRTGDVLLCQSVAKPEAEGGFAPVCVEASF